MRHHVISVPFQTCTKAQQSISFSRKPKPRAAAGGCKHSAKDAVFERSMRSFLIIYSSRMHYFNSGLKTNVKKRKVRMLRYDKGTQGEHHQTARGEDRTFRCEGQIVPDGRVPAPLASPRPHSHGPSPPVGRFLSLQISRNDRGKPPMVSVTPLLSLQALAPIETESSRLASEAAKLSSPFICLLTGSPPIWPVVNWQAWDGRGGEVPLTVVLSGQRPTTGT